MPIYLFKNPDREEYVEVHQKMTDQHVFIDDKGTEWERVWTAPSTSIGLQNDADSHQQFVGKRGYDHIGEAHENKRQKEIDSRKPSNKKNKS